MPAPANGRWDAEVVADYARAQARLVGTIGRPAPADPASRLEAFRQLMRRGPAPEDLVYEQVIKQMTAEERVQSDQLLAAEDEAKHRGK